MQDKFDEAGRTFETRLLFLKDIFSNLYEQDDIMAKCITHKLKRSYLSYLQRLNTDFLNVEDKDPIQVLRRIKIDKEQ